MNTKLLTYHNDKLTPEARWLLMKWALEIGLDQSYEGSLKALFVSLKMTYAQGRRAWDLLTKRLGENHEQLVEIERLPSKGRGRPASRYRLSAKLVKALQKSPSASEHHAEEIASLAKTTRLPVAKDEIALLFDRRSTGLLLSNRWLLMVLLAHADSPGIVTRLSISALRRLTGMSRYRITSQLKKLSDLGLIAHHQPGQYSPQAGTRKISTYLLDLAHPLMGKVGRESISILSPSSSIKYKRTELVDGIVDAVMAAGVCSRQIEALLKKYDAIEAAESDTAKSTSEEITPEDDPASLAKAYYKTKDIMQSALTLLPNTRYLQGGIEALLHTYNTDNADKLLASVHTDAMLMLSTCWLDLQEGRIGPDQPQADIIAGAARRLELTLEGEVDKPPSDEIAAVTEEYTHSSRNEDEEKNSKLTTADSPAKQSAYSPLAILIYALSHHLAKKLQGAFSPDDDIDFEALTYVMVPVYAEKPDKQQLLAYQLRGYGLKLEGRKDKQKNILYRAPVDEDLKTYWQTHHQDCLSAISDEPDDSATDTAEPAD
ncbi:MarR family transcriptional regulator [Vreelandella sp. V005]|uniref:MarR family transcriptional regulator n=1 Tax=Vreelandella sp. V005 TaxID=3459608 RepID=UPI0040449BC8